MKITLSIPDPLLVEIARLGETYHIPPATRAQVRAAIALDPVEGEEPDALRLDDIRGRQLAILARNALVVECEEPLTLIPGGELCVDSLCGEECAQIVRAILHHHLGQDPVQAEAVQGVLKKKALLLRLFSHRPPTAPKSGGDAQSDSTPIP